MSPLGLGIDIGTSGVRIAIVNEAGAAVATGRTALPREPAVAGPMAGDPRAVEAESWWRATERALDDALAPLGERRNDVRAMAVDGTSGSVVLVGPDTRPVTPGLLYDAKGFDTEGDRIDAVAPSRSVARGSGSALARALHLAELAPDATALCHQADFIVARLLGRAGHSDESNALKTGYDPAARAWPAWIEATGFPDRLLPKVYPVGAPIGEVGSAARERFGLGNGLTVIAGASDGTAAFLGATDGAAVPGTAVTSLGTTLTLKVASDRPVEDASRGIYSHRVGDTWLPGGASNTGGGALLTQFSAEEIAELSHRIDPEAAPMFEAYPLASAGERFPINDPNMQPRMGSGRNGDPDYDARYLHALLHGIARIEHQGYEALAALGAPYPTRVLTSGGGASNTVWTEIRRRLLGVPVERAEADPAFGMARLALRTVLS